MAFECGVTPVQIESVPIEAFGGDIPIIVELVPIEAFAGSSFEFGVAPVAVFGTFLDLLSGGAGGRFEFGATDIALAGVPLEYFQDFSPFEFGVTPIAVALVDADLYALPPATLAPSATGLDLVPTTREFEPPRYAVTFTRSMNGMSEAMLTGGKAGGAKMVIGYGAVEDEWAEVWTKLYDTSREVSPLELPDEVYSGLSVGLKNIYSLAKYGLKWFFVGPPRVESIKEGFSAVDVDLEGRNATRLPYSGAGFLAPDPTVPVVITDIGDPYAPLPDGDVTDEDEVESFFVVQDDNLGWADSGEDGGEYSEYEANGIVSRNGGGFVQAIGGVDGELVTRFFITGFDAAGDRMWRASFTKAGTSGNSRRQLIGLVAGGYLASALNINSPGAGSVRIELLGCDSSGTNPTVYAYSGTVPTPTRLTALAEDANGNKWFVVSNTNSKAYSHICKINSSYTVVSSKKFSLAASATRCRIESLVPANDSSGDIFVSGFTAPSYAGGSELALVARLSASMSVIWSRSYTVTTWASYDQGPEASEITIGADGNLFVACYAEINDPDAEAVRPRAFVAKINPVDGAVIAASRFYTNNLSREGEPDPTATNVPISIIRTAGGGIAISGEVYGGAHPIAGWFNIELTTDLDLTWSFETSASFGRSFNQYSYIDNYDSCIAVGTDSVYVQGNYYYGAAEKYKAPMVACVPIEDIVNANLDFGYGEFSTNPWIKSQEYFLSAVSCTSTAVTLVEESSDFAAIAALYAPDDGVVADLRLDYNPDAIRLVDP